MSGEFPLLVTAHSELFIHYWDLRNIFSGNFNPLGVTTSPLRCPTTSIQCFADGKGYAIGSIEGRCGIKYIDLSKNQINLADDFCFKSHRNDDASGSKVYAVNGLSFNKQFNTFATFGQDGSYYFWNKDTKSKLKSTKPAPWPVTAGDYLENATMFAYAFGYDWGKGAEEMKKAHYPVKIYVRKVKEDEAFKKKA
jgi:mRNA export factor